MKEVKITPPEGYEIDKENSTFDCIKFKPIEQNPKRWRDDEYKIVKGFFINASSHIISCAGVNILDDYNIFATEKQAKAALAMARISQIMANDERFGGVVTDEEWKDVKLAKFCLERINNTIKYWINRENYRFLAFHTPEQRVLFLEENEDLIKDYLML